MSFCVRMSLHIIIKMSHLRNFVLSNISNWTCKVEPGSFVGSKVFDFHMRLPQLLFLIPYKWNPSNRCFQLHAQKWKKILAYTMALQLYIFISFDVYSYFYAQVYENLPTFPNTAFKIVHFDLLLLETITIVSLSYFLFKPDHVQSLNFITKFDSRSRSGRKFPC